MNWQRIQDLGLRFQPSSIALALEKHGPKGLEITHTDGTWFAEWSGCVIQADTFDELMDETAYAVWFS